MTDKPTPTDAELNTILCDNWPAFAMQSTLVKIWLRDALQEAIDKWGQPAQKTVTVVPATGDVWLKHDDDLRYVRRVLEAGRQMTDVDQRAAIDIVQGLRVTARSMAVDAKKPAQAAEPVAGDAAALDHIAAIEDGELRYMTGRKAPAYDCELYAMPDGKRAPVLFTAPQPAAKEPVCKGVNCSAVRGVGHSTECESEHDSAALTLNTAGNRNPEARYAGYKGQPALPAYTEDQLAAWQEGASARITTAAPQPVAREPLTYEQIQDLLLCGNPTDEEMRLIRIGWDAAHGIKGGQHVE